MTWSRLAAAATLVLAFGCRESRSQTVAPSRPEPSPRGAPSPAPVPPAAGALVVVQSIYDGGLRPGWQDWGWAKHDDVPGGAARVDLAGWAGWQLVRPGLAGAFGGVTFRFQAPAAFGEFLTVHLEGGGYDFPKVAVDAAHRKPLADGWSEVVLGMDVLDPDDLPFERVVFFVSKEVPHGWVSIDKVGLTLAAPAPPRPPPRVVDRAMSVTCSAGSPISPLIYGIALDSMHDKKDQHQWALGATARRWGGNPSSRYNWELGNAWNTASDWFFENVDYTGDPRYSYARFLDDDRAHGVQTALTVPMLGWVAKDTVAVGFSRAVFGDQAAFDEGRPDAGNGVRNGKPLAPGAPSATSLAAPPAFVQRWVEAIRREDGKRGGRSVHEYILDNEPNLWSTTHRDVHPEAVTYDELLARTIAYGTAIRAADPEAVIAGPAEWGWTNYFYSADDLKRGLTLRLDRRAHGDTPLLEWYLERLRDHEQKTGTRILDVLDLHFYPQGERLYSKAADRKTAALRLRSTRALWDASYVDESWIHEPIALLPRMKAWVAQGYPGRGTQLGEWNFGAEQHLSGGLAVAEALGRFGQYDLTSAFYWSYPPEGSPAFWAFRAYRNFDGKGGHFEALSLPAKAEEGTSLFASRDQAGHHLVLVALNLSPDEGVRAHIEAAGCGRPSARRAYVYTGGPAGFSAARPLPTEGPLVVDLPPYSITVLEVDQGG